MTPSLKPLTSLLRRRGREAQADQLYGSIVAQTRLPVFYQRLGVPDTLEGRFVVLSLHLFAVLHRLKAAGVEAEPLARDMADRFAADMETVLREIGIGDLAVPKKVRKLVASGAALLDEYEEAYGEDEQALAATIARALPLDAPRATAASGRLIAYVVGIVRDLEARPLQDLYAGNLQFPEP